MMVMVMVMVTEELRKLDPRLSLSGCRLVFTQCGNGVRHRFEQIGVSRRSYKLGLLRQCGLGSDAGRHANGRSRSEQAGNLFVHVLPSGGDESVALRPEKLAHSLCSKAEDAVQPQFNKKAF
jgi:hypothetical protein